MGATTLPAFRRDLRLWGRTLQKIAPGENSGATFRATINRSLGEFDLLTEQGNDPRAKRIMELLNAGAPEFNSQDQVKDLKTNEIFSVVAPQYDGPDYSQRWCLQQVVPGLDTP
jgi:hypothetical protein